MKMKNSLVLGLETSCDETSAAVVCSGRQILSNVIASQSELHQLYGGVVPEIASRRHLELVSRIVAEALCQAGVGLQELEGIAVTNGPGLVGSLLVGVSFAKGLSYALGLPLVGVNHLEGHIMANLLHQGRESLPEDFPAATTVLALVVSGGHTSLVLWEPGDTFRQLGASRDDAAGEALDKVARVLGLGYPGGPALEKEALQGDPQGYKLPGVALEGSLDFSFSGLKTGAINLLHKVRQQGSEPNIADMAAAFQSAVVQALVSKTAQALQETGARHLLLAGGVAANATLRQEMDSLAGSLGVSLHIPPMALCTDNGAMIAAAGYRRLQQGVRAPLSLNAYPGLKLG